MNPIVGSFTGVYVVAGRVIDALGQPVARGEVVVELDQPGVRAQPLRAATDCFGVFLTSFDLRDVKPEGKVHVTFKGQGGPDARATAPLDAFHRRTDLKLRYEGQWAGGCPDQTHLWGRRVSVTGRVVNRTEPYEENGVTYHARPEAGRAVLYFWISPGAPVCPPRGDAPGSCDLEAGRIDERGDFRYSWVFDQPLDLRPDQRVEVLVAGRSHNLTVDPEWRVATVLLDASGRGPPPREEAPAAPLPLVLGVLALLVLVRRRPP